MKTSVDVQGDVRLELRRAVLIYQGAGGAFATVHDVQLETEEPGPPHLGPGQPLTHAFLRHLATSLEQRLPPEILPEHVLARTPDMVAWWRPPGAVPMFFGERSPELHQLSGRSFPQPSLVFAVAPGEWLRVRAVMGSTRPAADAPLCRAPYWNVDRGGRVCLGSMPRPDGSVLRTLGDWEDAFFGSRFTHPYGVGRLTMHPAGFEGLWPELVGQDVFPDDMLVETDASLAEWVRSLEA